MGHSQADKAASRERILAEAAAQIRAAGLDALSVGPLMRSVGLTHGGFYGHFESRADLLAQALARALADGAATSSFAPDAAGQAPAYASSVRRYLSRAHRDAPASGCTLAALAADVARADAPSRAVMSAQINHLAGGLAPQMGADDPADALFAISAMLGTLLVSRVLVDRDQSDALLQAARRHLLALGTGQSEEQPGVKHGDNPG
jgi:TetR/AcrR family transcriptional repressor of nem operon